MMRSSGARRGQYMLCRYLESDWRQQFHRDSNLEKSREIFKLIQNNHAASAVDDESRDSLRLSANIFTKNGQTDELNAVLRFLRVVTPLQASHFNQVFRCLAQSSQQKPACVNLLSLMVEKGDVDSETVAVAVCAMHSWGGRNRLQSILSLLRKVHNPVAGDAAAAAGADYQQKTKRRSELADSSSSSSPADAAAPPPLPFDALPLAEPWRVQTAWEIALFPKAVNLTLPRRAIELDEFREKNFEYGGGGGGASSSSSKDNNPPCFRQDFKEAATISALMFALACGAEGVVATLVAAVWLLAAGAELSAFDYFHILMVLARDAEHFHEVRRVFFSSNVQNGEVSLAEVRNILDNNLHATSHSFAPHSREFAAARDVATLAVELLERAEPGSSTRPVFVGFLNCPNARSADEAVQRVFDDIHSRPTVGFAGESPQNIHHAYALLLMSLRRDSVAVGELASFMQRAEAWELKFARSAEAMKANPPLSAHEQMRQRLAAADAEARVLEATTSQKKKSLFQIARRPAAAQTAAADSSSSSSSSSSQSAAIVKPFRYAPPFLPRGDKTLRLALWFPKDVAYRFPAVPRAIADRAKPVYDELCERAGGDAEEVDVWMCWAMGLPLRRRYDEVKQAVDTVLENLNKREGERSLRMMVRCLIQMFALLPPARAPAAAGAALEERRKWGRYFESRDAALALFGFTKAGREAMRRSFSDDGRLQAMRSADVIESDIADVCELFGVKRASLAVDASDSSRAPSPYASKVPMAKRLSTRSLLGNLPPVPEHIVSGAASGYPMMQMMAGAADSSSDASSQTKKNSNSDNAAAENGSGEGAQKDIDQLFYRMHNALKSQTDPWWFSENETAGNYLRCLLYRFEWQAACDAAAHIAVKKGYQAGFDAEVHRIFDEIGDPTGAMCFKFATRLIDGRILDSKERQKGQRNRSLIFGSVEQDGAAEDEIKREQQREQHAAQ